MYTYSSYRLIIPIVIGGISFWSFSKKEKETRARNALFFALVVAFLVSIPLIQFSFSSFGNERFYQTSAFSEYPVKSNIQKILVYPAVFIKNYISYFSSQFLLVSGDGIGRHEIPNFGVILLWQIPFLIIGAYLLLTSRLRYKYFIFFILGIAPVAASIARPSPHALRALLMIVPFIIFISFGIAACLTIRRKILFFFIVILVCGVYETFSYFHFYYVHYPKTNILDWGAEYKLVSEKIRQYSQKYPHIVVDKALGSSGVYFSFYGVSEKLRYIDGSWKKPASWPGTSILRIGPYMNRSNIQLIDTVYLKNINRDPFIQIWVEP